LKLGIDVGGTFVKFTDGKRAWKEKTPKTSSELLNLISETIKETKAKMVGIAVAGLVNSKTGTITESPNLKFLNGLNVKREVERRTSALVSVFNDATAAAFGEYKLGAGRNSSILICLTIGTGLGGGAVIGGKPLLGVSGTAMEVGHTTVEVNGETCRCGRKGCLEAYVSSYGIERFYEREFGEKLSSFEIIEKAKEGEKRAIKTVERMAFYLSVGITNLIHIFNPDVVVLSGGIPAHYPELLKITKEKVKLLAFNQPASDFSLRQAKLSEFSGAFGALYLLQHVLNQNK